MLRGQTKVFENLCGVEVLERQRLGLVMNQLVSTSHYFCKSLKRIPVQFELLAKPQKSWQKQPLSNHREFVELFLTPSLQFDIGDFVNEGLSARDEQNVGRGKRLNNRFKRKFEISQSVQEISLKVLKPSALVPDFAATLTHLANFFLSRKNSSSKPLKY